MSARGEVYSILFYMFSLPVASGMCDFLLVLPIPPSIKIYHYDITEILLDVTWLLGTNKNDIITRRSKLRCVSVGILNKLHVQCISQFYLSKTTYSTENLVILHIPAYGVPKRNSCLIQLHLEWGRIPVWIAIER